MNLVGDGPQDFIVGSLATIHLEAASNQNTFDYTLPTVGSWFGKNWYVLFVICLFLVACIIGMTVSLLRWKARKKYRDQRAHKGKAEVAGGLTTVTKSLGNFSQRGRGSFSGRSSNAPSRSHTPSQDYSAASVSRSNGSYRGGEDDGAGGGKVAGSTMTSGYRSFTSSRGDAQTNPHSTGGNVYTQV